MQFFKHFGRYLTCAFLIIFANACRKDDTIKVHHVTVLPDYSYSMGYCEGAFLGIDILDKNTYLSKDTLNMPDSLLLHMPPAGDQGSQGSCAAWAIVYAAGSYAKSQLTGLPYVDSTNLSPKFTFNQITKGNCTCTSLLDHLYLFKNQGANQLYQMPYDPNECALQPTDEQFKLAAPFKIKDWAKIDTKNLTLVKKALNDSLPVIFAIPVDEGFSTLPIPYHWNNTTGLVRGDHAMVVVGYNDRLRAFRIMNSWGRNWADKGFAWVNYDFFQSNVFSPGYILIRQGKTLP